MQKIKKFLSWLVFSSKDSEKLSLTIKSFFTGVALLAGLLHLPLEVFTNLQDATINAINSFLVFMSAIGLLIGAFRKVKTTVMGTNSVLLNKQL